MKTVNLSHYSSFSSAIRKIRERRIILKIITQQNHIDIIIDDYIDRHVTTTTTLGS